MTWRCFKNSGLSIAMGNATDDVKKLATQVTTTNETEGFAGAIDIILRSNQQSNPGC
jgi:hydroxymethylpyrimidine pyrophosphatase-like HAD family hydrolase